MTSYRPLSRVRFWLAAVAATTVLTAGLLWYRGAFAETTANLSPADVRQRELLQVNVGLPGERDLVDLFNTINERHFAGKLPAIAVRWESGLDDVGALAGHAFTLQGMYGRSGKQAVILLNPKMVDDPAAIRRALCHEMVHAYLSAMGDSSTSHGPAFKVVLRRLADEGAFEGIAATDEEKTALRTWLDDESARLDRDRKDLEALGAKIESERAAFDHELGDLNARASEGADAANRPSVAEVDDLKERREQINHNVLAVNERIARGREALAHFNSEVARYNLMIIYPDGLDDEPVMASKAAIPGGG